MLLATLALSLTQPAPFMPQTVVLALNETAAAHAPCNPDSSKSIGCVANRYEPSRKTVMNVPIVCNSDPLKGAACNAHVAAARAEQRREDQLTSAAD